MGNFAKWRKRADPWSDFFENRQSLKEAARLLTTFRRKIADSE
jgi:hypothetical protein